MSSQLVLDSLRRRMRVSKWFRKVREVRETVPLDDTRERRR